MFSITNFPTLMPTTNPRNSKLEYKTVWKLNSEAEYHTQTRWKPDSDLTLEFLT